MKPSQTAQILRRIAAAIENSRTPDRAMVAADLKKVLRRMLPAHTASGTMYNPRPGDSVSVTVGPRDDRTGSGLFLVEGKIDYRHVSGTARTSPQGGLQFTPHHGFPELDEDQYDTIVDIIGEADPVWNSSFASTSRRVQPSSKALDRRSR